MPVFVLNKGQLTPPRTPAAATGVEIADECRAAGNLFCAGASSDWTKEDLVAWLRGPYAAATSYVSQPERVATGVGARRVAGVEIRRLLRDTLGEVHVALERGMHNCPPDFVRPLIRDRVIVSAPRGKESIWLPVDSMRLALTKRVLSLFAVDKLVRPEDYTSPFASCARCGSVLISREDRTRGLCDEHDRPSGAVPRDTPAPHD